jgi:hypothetical protein
MYRRIRRQNFAAQDGNAHDETAQDGNAKE